MMSDSKPAEAIQSASRRFPPSVEFSENAIAQPSLYELADKNRLEFWANQARNLHWHKPFTKTLDWRDAPFAKWFEDGQLNVAYNCLDRHVAEGRGERVAIHFEGEPGDTKSYTYTELTSEVKRTANALLNLGVTKGDRVVIYLPMIPEAAIAMLACARIGAIHSVVFGGFSAEALHTRIDDTKAKLVITADGGYRKGKEFGLKSAVDEALAHGKSPSVKNVLVIKRTGQKIEWNEGTDLWWQDVREAAEAEHVAEAFGSETPLFILYTSGTTGKPKGILHTSGGYLTQAAFTHKNVFDLHSETDVYWCTADVGWITGHSYVVYGPLANGATQVIYEGTPDSPHPGRWWEIIEKYKVSIFYTAPTAIRSFMKVGRQVPDKFDLSSLRVLGSVGEPINPEAWMWYRDVIGASKCPIVDTWWQTETGAIMISPLPGVTSLKPGSAQLPLPGISMAVLDDDGNPVTDGNAGYLAITEPWPSMLRGIWQNPERYIEGYWSRFAGLYFAGDGAKLDEDGDLWVLGRVDDVMNVSGHRLSTAEIESALVAHPWVAEAAVVGASDEITGETPVGFVILRTEKIEEAGTDERVNAELRAWVSKEIGAIARPRQVLVVPELPKTRSGKIMRRLLRDAAEGRAIGDVTTLSDSTIMQKIAAKLAEGYQDLNKIVGLSDKK